jgi:predicted DNA-binding transcriptional regulator AlpA
MPRTYSTVEVAKKLGIAQPNLQRLIRTGKIQPPPVRKLGSVKIRLWSNSDIKKARKAIKGKR